MRSTPYFCPNLTKFGFFEIYSYKSPQYKISRKCVQWEPRWYVVHTDRHDEASRRLWCVSANAPKMSALDLLTTRSCHGKQ